MKAIIISLVSMVILLFFSGCDKYHRNKYIGSWYFITERIYYNEDYNSTALIEVKRDTVYYIGKITLGNYDSDLTFKYTDKDEVVIWIDEDENISSRAGYMFGKYPSGEFKSKNKLYLELRWGQYVPFEGENDFRFDYIHGSKKKGDKK